MCDMVGKYKNCVAGWGGWVGLAELKDAELKSLALRVSPFLSAAMGGSGKTKGDKKNTRKRRRGKGGKKKRMATKKRGPLCRDSLKDEDHQ